MLEDKIDDEIKEDQLILLNKNDSEQAIQYEFIPKFRSAMASPYREKEKDHLKKLVTLQREQ